MALPSGAVAAHRRDLQALVRLAQNDLRLFIEPLDGAERTRDALLEVLPRLVSIYGSAAATLAADWYDDLRDQAGAGGRFSAIPAAAPTPSPAGASARSSPTSPTRSSPSA